MFMEVREKRGLAYAIYSYLSSFEDTGLWGIYTAVSRETAAKTVDLVGRELLKVRQGVVKQEELEAAREFVKGGILLGAENSDNRMTRLAKNEIHFGRHVSFEEVLEALQRVRLEDLVRLAEESLRPELFSLVALGPIQAVDLPAPWQSWS